MEKATGNLRSPVECQLINTPRLHDKTRVLFDRVDTTNRCPPVQHFV